MRRPSQGQDIQTLLWAALLALAVLLNVLVPANIGVSDGVQLTSAGKFPIFAGHALRDSRQGDSRRDRGTAVRSATGTRATNTQR